jgi:hypothetical protein
VTTPMDQNTNNYRAPAADDSDGAFGSVGDITWTNGFGDEDAPGGPRQGAAQRPVSAPQQQVTPQQPVAAPSRPAPVQQATSPAPAQRPQHSALQRVPVAGNRQPVRPPAPVQRPGQQPVQAPIQRPAQQRPAPVAQPQAPAVPAQAPVAPQAPAVQPQAPVAPQVPVAPPQAQAPVAQPAPQMPVQPPVAQFQPPVQPQAPAQVQRQAPPASVTAEVDEEPPWASINRRPAPGREEEPTWSPDSEDAEFGQDVFSAPDTYRAPVAHTPAPTAPPRVPEPAEPTSKRGKGKKDRSRPEKNTSAKTETPAKKGSPLAGGRWKIAAFRGFFFLLMGLLIAGGFKNVVAKDEPVSVDTLTTQVAAALGQNGFPTEEAEAFAIRFANTYLSYSPDTRSARDAALATYAQEGVGTGFRPAENASQSIVSGPFVSGDPELTSAEQGVITVTAQVNSGAWVYLSIPVYADNKTGGLAISGEPAFVAAPVTATPPGETSLSTDSDDELEASLSTDVLPLYFRNWAASDETSLKLLLDKTATQAATTGLHGMFTLDRLGDVSVPVTGGDKREIEATVQWNSPSVGVYTQTYRLTIVKGSDGNWKIQDIKGGVVN